MNNTEINRSLLIDALKYAFYQRLMNLCYDLYREDGAALHDAMRSVRHELTFGRTTDIRYQFGSFYPGDLMASDAFCGMVNTTHLYDKEILWAVITEIWGTNWPVSLVDVYGRQQQS